MHAVAAAIKLAESWNLARSLLLMRSATCVQHRTQVIRPAASMADSGTAPPAKFRKIAVFCGASTGANPAYMAAARELGAEMARRGIGLVYGVSRRPPPPAGLGAALPVAFCMTC
jgi:hypothetical protein